MYHDPKLTHLYLWWLQTDWWLSLQSLYSISEWTNNTLDGTFCIFTLPEDHRRFSVTLGKERWRSKSHLDDFKLCFLSFELLKGFFSHTTSNPVLFAFLFHFFRCPHFLCCAHSRIYDIQHAGIKLSAVTKHYKTTKLHTLSFPFILTRKEQRKMKETK